MGPKKIGNLKRQEWKGKYGVCDFCQQRAQLVICAKWINSLRRNCDSKVCDKCAKHYAEFRWCPFHFDELTKAHAKEAI